MCGRKAGVVPGIRRRSHKTNHCGEGGREGEDLKVKLGSQDLETWNGLEVDSRD